MAKQKDINDVTDEISLIMREVVEATENNMQAEIALSLNEGLDKVKNPADFARQQAAKKRAVQRKLQKVAFEAQKTQLNVAKNIGTYAGINTAPLEQDIKKGVSILLQSAQADQDAKVKEVIRLTKYNTSAQYIPDLKKSIVEQTVKGIDQGLPVTYKGGRKIGYREYMEMAVRTGIQQEIGQQQLEIANRANIVFWLCDEFADCADDHAEYQGKIYYNKDYATLGLTDEAKQKIAKHIAINNLLSVQEVRDDAPYLTTRPNCRHRLIPISIDEAIEDSLESVKQSNDSVRGNYRPENYDALKQQRAYERNIRQAKSKLGTLELIKSKTKTNDYDAQIAKMKHQIARQQAGLRKLLSDYPDLSRERRRETRKILISDVGVKYNLKTGGDVPPTPVGNEPPPTTQPPTSKVVQEHYNVPEEKKQYVKKSYDIPWSRINAYAKTEKQRKLWDSWQDLLNNKIEKDVEITDPETGELIVGESESRQITGYFYKGLNLYDADSLTITPSVTRGYWDSFNNQLVTTDISGDEGLKKVRGIQTNTHELGHAIDTSLAVKFGYIGRVDISQIGLPSYAINLLQSTETDKARADNTYQTKYSYRDYYQQDTNSQKLTDEQKADLFGNLRELGATQDQIEILQHSMEFNEGIYDAQLVKQGGRANAKDVNNFIQDKQNDKAVQLFEKEKKDFEAKKDVIYEQTGYNEAQKRYKNAYDILANHETEKASLSKKIYRYDQLQNPVNRETAKSLGWDKEFANQEEYEKAKENLQKLKDRDATIKDEIDWNKISDEREQKLEEANKLLKIEQEKFDSKEAATGQLSDFYDALTGGRYFEGNARLNNIQKSGHGQDYYKNQRYRSVEIFTHLCTINMHYPAMYQALKEDYPDIVNAHEKIMAKGQEAFEKTKGQTGKYALADTIVAIDKNSGVLKR